MKQINIHDLFISLFFLPKKVERDENFDDNVYTQAHSEFMENAKIIENKIPSLKDGYDDNEEWYDELRDDIVNEYSEIIESIS